MQFYPLLDGQFTVYAIHSYDVLPKIPRHDLKSEQPYSLH